VHRNVHADKTDNVSIAAETGGQVESALAKPDPFPAEDALSPRQLLGAMCGAELNLQTITGAEPILNQLTPHAVSAAPRDFRMGSRTRRAAIAWSRRYQRDRGFQVPDPAGAATEFCGLIHDAGQQQGQKPGRC